MQGRRGGKPVIHHRGDLEKILEGNKKEYRKRYERTQSSGQSGNMSGPAIYVKPESETEKNTAGRYMDQKEAESFG